MSDKVVVMQAGQKLQEGTPEEVYNNSTSHFVADFLGHSNFAEGVVLGREGDWLRVRLEDGHEFLANPSSGGWSAGDHVEVVVRAQKFKIEPRAQAALNSGINHFYGTVKNRSYMGGEISYFVELENGTMAHVINLVVSQSLQRGEQVAVQVDPDHCRLLPGK
jgi:putative spermidine/putrescine transport system ATP-binding protein/spermidine/putrescine transport system ATP-binding protein